ncbi:MAG: HAD-IA family hydrolase [Gammaproteobacteria bacterium]|nr:HAD-IA family hydrolase [Gammaproteobacteria bacterium]
MRRFEQYVNGIRTITLDLDDTLWDITPVIRRAEKRLHDWLAERYPRIVDMHQPEDIVELRARVIAEFPDRSHDLTFIRCRVLARMGVAAGYGDDFVDEAFDVFDRERNTLELFPEVRPALESLASRYTLVAVTNGNARLERIGIDHFFQAVVSAHSAGAAKPARPIFDAAVSVGGAAAHETLHVGDHPEFDVDGARSAGLRTVWLNRNGHDWPGSLEPPERTVADLQELDELLAGPERPA